MIICGGVSQTDVSFYSVVIIDYFILSFSSLLQECDIFLYNKRTNDKLQIEHAAQIIDYHSFVNTRKINAVPQ
jgi:hypothetical protein